MSKACHAQALNNGGRLVAQLHEFRGGIERAPSAVPAAPLARRSIGRRIGRVAIFACSASLRHITAALTARAPHMMRTLVQASLQANTVQSRASAHLCRAGRLLHSFSAARSATGSRWLPCACGGVWDAPRCSRFLLAEPGAHASRMSTAAAKRSNGIAAAHVSHRALTLARTSFADTPRSCTATQYI